MKDSNKRIRTILIFIVAIPLCFYVLPKAVFYQSVCKGIQESGGLVEDFLFFSFCPTEVIEQWYENLFWQECVKQDQQIPPNAELLISACTDPIVHGMPGGELLFVHEKKTGEAYLLDLRTGEKRQVPNQPLLLERRGIIFLNSELAWLTGQLSPGDEGYRPHYVLDLSDGQKYELIDLRWDFDTTLDNGDLNPDLLPYFTEAEQVFISYEYNSIIALAPNFRQNPKINSYFNQSSFGQGNRPENGELLVKLLKELEVDYEVVDVSLHYVEVPSPNGKYVAREDGIFFSDSDIPVIKDENIPLGYIRGFNGWYYDESGIIFAQPNYYYMPQRLLLEQFFFPYPILKLNLPLP
jgi:hypothetical protein